MELVVRVVDKYTGDDPVTRATTTGSGDVIAVKPDGFPWSEIERTSPNWLIVRVDIPEIEARAMLSQEPGFRIENPTLRIRAFGLDMDYLASRYDLKTIAEISAEDFRSAKYRKPPIDSQGL